MYVGILEDVGYYECMMSACVIHCFYTCLVAGRGPNVILSSSIYLLPNTVALASLSVIIVIYVKYTLLKY